MIKIGCHLSSAGGFMTMAQTAVGVGANVFQFFTRNPRGGAAKEIDPKDVKSFLDFEKQNSFGPIIGHASYTLNLCSANPSIRHFSKEIFADDIRRAEMVPNNLYNFHPGSHTGQGIDQAIEEIAKAVNFALKPEQTTIVLLETMSGKGSEMGGSFEEIRKIIDSINLKDKMGVCLDTCHVWDAGYDVVNNLDGVLEEFDKVIGIERLKAVHLNDSKNPLGSRKDRHEKVGQGYIGLEAIKRIVNNPVFKNLPFILETPHETLEGYTEEIKLVRSLSD